MRLGKKAAINWTIGKLIKTVLLLVIMALVIFGITTGGLNPLIEKVGGKFDEVLIMLNIKEGVSTDECFSAEVVSLGGGKVFLEEIEWNGSSLVMNVCRNRMCNFTGGMEDYRVNKGVFEKIDGEEWKAFGKLFSGDLEIVKFNWEVYRQLSDILENDEGLEFLKEPRFTGEFVLHGEDRFTPSMVATWQNNVWTIKHGEILDKFIEDDNEAIDIFASKVWGGLDDKVTYNDGMGGSGVIGELVGHEGWPGSEDELDSDEEIAKLKVEFAKRKVELLLEKNLSLEEIEKLSRAVSGKEITVGERTFKLGVKKGKEVFLITLSSGDLELRFKYLLRGGYNDVFSCGRSSLPFVFKELIAETEKKGSIKTLDGVWQRRGDEGYYKLGEKCFEEVYRDTLTRDFLREKCR